MNFVKNMKLKFIKIKNDFTLDMEDAKKKIKDLIWTQMNADYQDFTFVNFFAYNLRKFAHCLYNVNEIQCRG